MSQNGTGIIYPTIELEGKTYELKVTRGALLYRLSKAGVNIADIQRGDFRSYSAVMDVLFAMIQDQGSPFANAEMLAVHVQELGSDKVREIGNAVRAAVGKAFPPATPAAPAEANKQPAIQ